MDEWSVVTVIITLLGLLTAVISPIIKLNNTLTRITATVGTLEKDLATLSAQSSHQQEQLNLYNFEQDKLLANHETRLSLVEHKRK